MRGLSSSSAADWIQRQGEQDLVVADVVERDKEAEYNNMRDQLHVSSYRGVQLRQGKLWQRNVIR